MWPYCFESLVLRAKDVLGEDRSVADHAGLNVRKNAIATFLSNAAIFADRTASKDDRRVAARDIVAALPQLRAAGLFDVMSIRNHTVRFLVESAG